MFLQELLHAQLTCEKEELKDDTLALLINESKM
jgi:hypothetical protein